MIGIGDKMRKIGGKSFWIILIISIVTLIILTVGVIFLTRKNEKEFYAAGYIINSTATKSDKYYFNDNTVYKENVFDEYVFKDKDNKEVSTSKDNFIHYLDNSISFMKNGVILDLNNLETVLVPYYNITDKSIIQYNNGSYYIENDDKTLILGNFLGRITENKYIIAGSNISIKLAGNDTPVKGDYFEILFAEKGIVKIENQEGSYQTVSDGTVVYVGSDIKIDLGEKKVFSKDVEKLLLSEMTIDGNENIDIEPKGKVDKNESTGLENGTNSDNNTVDGNAGNNNQEGNDNSTNNIDGEGGTTSVLKKEVSVDLLTASAGINDLTASFQVIDTDNFIKGDLVLTLVNSTTGETVYSKLLADTMDIQNVYVTSLAPDCDYVMTISESNNETSTQYFKKMFKTESIDLKLVRDLVTLDSLSYVLDFGVDSIVKSANVSLYDESGNQIGATYTVINGEDNSVIFDGLNKNTIYNVVVDSVVFNNTVYASTYTIKTSDITLKEKPILGEISVDTDPENQKFTLKMDKPTDNDNSITKYTYEIYKADDLTEDNISNAKPIYSFSQEKLKDVTLGLGENNLVEKQDYRFRVIVEYYDNYKHNEIETNFSDYFQVVGKPSITFDEEVIDFNLIKGTIKIKDEGCLIPFDGRECNNDVNDIVIYQKVGTSIVKNINGNFVQDSNNPNQYNMDLELSGLTENTTYLFEIYSKIDLKNGSGMQEGQYIGGFSVTTKGIESLKMENWKQNESSFDNPISVNTTMVSTVPESNYGDKLATLTFKLYRGDVKNGILTEPIKIFKDTENIKSKYYNKEFTITSSMFGISNLDELRELSGGKLNRYYTIEVTDAYDESMTNEFNIMDNMFVFETPSVLLLEDEVEKPTIIVEELTNGNMKSGNYDKSYDPNLADSIVVGYQVIANFNKSKIETYFQGNNPVMSINFHISSIGRDINLDASELTIDLTKEDNYTKYFFLDYGTDYGIVDNSLRRGNTYTFSYDISIDTNNDGEADTLFPSSKPTSDKMTSYKQDPSFRMYIDNSTDNSITYKYKIFDYDNALYKDSVDDKYYFYYKVDDGEEIYKSEIMKQDDYGDVTIHNLSNSSLYSIIYYRASTKRESDVKEVNLGKYLFDGAYNALDYNLGYELKYGNFDNRLQVIVSDNEFLNRVSAYLLTLDAGTSKYQIVVSDFESCGEDKCIVIDYSKIADLKGKDIKVSLVGFYDTGYIGFNQVSRLGGYFESLGLVDSANASKVGYVYQTTNTTERGKYLYINNNGAWEVSSSKPRGILGYDLTKGENDRINWKLSTVNLLNINDKKFVNYGDISNNLSVYPFLNGITDTSASVSGGTKNTFNPKVLDKVNIQTSDDKFIFTSITPKVDTTVKPLINGAVIDIKLSIDPETLESDFVKTDGKYNFYIDIYTKNECQDEDESCEVGYTYLKSITTDYDNLTGVTFEGLDPDTKYYYKISADMNKNNKKEKIPLFDYNAAGYVEYMKAFETLGKEEVFQRVAYNYTSLITDSIYSKRDLNITAYLYTNINFDVKYELYDNEGNLEYESVISNAEVTGSGSKYTAKYVQDITGNDFVFGENYHTLIIYAVTTDLGKKLELYNAKLINGGLGSQQDIGELVNPVFNVSQEAIINTSDGVNNYAIKYTITLKDEDKVIKDGIYNIELQNKSGENACPGHEDDCKAIVDIKGGTCTIGGSSKNCIIVNQDQNGNQILSVMFDNLTPNTNYSIYVSANTYRNNVSLTEKEGLVYVKKTQFTKSDLGFSLGDVTPNVVNGKLVVTFIGASNIKDKIKKIDYNVVVEGGEKIGEGTLEIGKNVYFSEDKDGYPTLEMSIYANKEFGLSNRLILTYYYIDDSGNLQVLMFGSDTNKDYTFNYKK